MPNPTHSTPQILCLFSGGLDGLLAARLLMAQNLSVLCLHFHSPFFGKPEKIHHWERIYNLSIRPVDISTPFAAMLAARPAHGFGSVMNPCVDCKILMLTHARAIMKETGAAAVATGEVLGQRPMSQRRDTLNIIQRETGLKGRLLRPLSALRLEPTEPELSGLVDRSRLLGIGGRGRKDQLSLAASFGIKEIPTPAGGCRLAEKENARSYLPVLLHSPSPTAGDFDLANAGRQLWRFDPAPHRLIVGRKQADNDLIQSLAGPNDLIFKVADHPGPLALARHLGRDWPEDTILAAAATTASYAPKAVAAAGDTGTVDVRVHAGHLDNPGRTVAVTPRRDAGFAEQTWEEAETTLRAERRGQPQHGERNDEGG